MMLVTVVAITDKAGVPHHPSRVASTNIRAQSN
jgi:hypothetical protein